MLLLNRISIVLIASTVLAASSCSRAQRKVQVLPPTTQPVDGKDPGTTYEPKVPPVDPTLPGSQEPGGEGSAVFVARIDQTELAKYVDLNAKLEYRFQYLSKDETGIVTLTNGKAEISVKGLEIGKSGDLTVELLENGTVKLKGTLPAVTLKAGQNALALPLSVVGGGGDDVADGDDGADGADGADDTAELILTITIEEEGGTTTTPPDSTGAALAFTEIQPLAETYCVGCHPTASTEKFWADGSAEIARRLEFPTTNSRSMPLPESTEQVALSAANRAKLLKFVQD